MLTAGMARQAADTQQVLCVDADPWSCGTDFLLGLEEAPGLRWADLERLTGAPDPAALLAELPSHQGLRVLGGDRRPYRRGPAGPERIAEALAAEVDLAVIDLPPPGPSSPAWWAICDSIVVLVGPGVDQMVSATALIDLMPRVAGVVRRGPRRRGDLDLAALLGVPMVGRVPHDPTVSLALSTGRPVAGGGSRLAGVCTALLARLDTPGVAA